VLKRIARYRRLIVSAGWTAVCVAGLVIAIGDGASPGRVPMAAFAFAGGLLVLNLGYDPVLRRRWQRRRYRRRSGTLRSPPGWDGGRAGRS
jgi:hypothetical protein